MSARLGQGTADKITPRWIALGLVAVTLTLYSFTGNRLYSGDGFVYAEVSQEMLAGRKMYSEAWQDKPPLALLFYLPPQVCCPRSAIALQIWLGIWVLLQVAIVCLVSPTGTTRLQKGIAAALLVLLPLSSEEFAWASTENASNLFVVYVLWASYGVLTDSGDWAPRLWSIGLMLALAFNVRQNVVLYGLPAGLAVLLRSRDVHSTARRLAWLLVGFVAGLLVVMALAAMLTDFNDYIDPVFFYPGRYAGAAPADESVGIVWSLLGELLDQPLGVGLAVLLTSNVFCRWRGCGRRRIFLCGCLAIGIVQGVLPLKPFGHYWANLIPVAALLAFALLEDLPKKNEASPWRAVLCLTLCGITTALSGGTLCRAKGARDFSGLNEIARLTNELTRPGDTIYVCSDWKEAAYICFATTARESYRYFFCMHLDPFWCDCLKQPIDAVLADYEAAPPRLIVMKTEWFRQVKEDEPNSRKLARRLLSRYSYDALAETYSHTILRLSPPEAR